MTENQEPSDPSMHLGPMRNFPQKIILACLTAGYFFFFPISGLFAQSALPTSLQQAGTLTPERRDALRGELRRHAEVLEAQAAVTRTVAKLIDPAVVFIEADHETRMADGRVLRVDEAGSGVIIEWKGQFYILTNRHVIRDTPPQSVKITLSDGRRIAPDKFWGDAEFDVGVLAVSVPNLTPAAIGDSDKLDVGDFVLAVGSPFGLTHSVTFGIVSGKGRRNLKLDGSSRQAPGGSKREKDLIQDFLQTDAAINPGNSGGPLVNMQGEVVGINTCIASNSGKNEGIGFAIPSNLFMFVARQLIETGKVTRAYIGVTLNAKFGPNMAAEIGLPRPMGAQVNAVTPNSPAASAGLQPGDIILEFNHIPIEDDLHLVNVVSVTPLGKSVPLLVYRDRRTVTVNLEVSPRSKFESQ